MLGWMKYKLKSKLPEKIPITADMQMTPPLGKNGRGNKEPLEEGERRE